MGANAQTAVPTFTAGQVLTAAQMNESARTGVPVFATTVERDAAFGGTGEKVLAEGQLAYIEAGDVVQYYTGSTWAPVSRVVQVVQATYNTATAIASTSYNDTGLTASITPGSTSNKILVIVAQIFQIERQSNAGVIGSAQILRGATSILDFGAFFYVEAPVGASGYLTSRASHSFVYLDSPSTTSSTAYKTQAKVDTTANNGRITAQPGSSYSSITLIEIAG
jgi:hypothetical protein